MRLLAVEASSSVGSIAIFNGAAVFEKTWRRERHQGEQLLPSIEEGLVAAQLKIKDIDMFAVGLGPGSFTGIRVSLNAIQTFAYIQKRPIFGISSLEILARSIPASQNLPVLTLVNAHSHSVYVAIFKYHNGQLETRLKPSCVLIKKLGDLLEEPHLCLGDGFEIAKGELEPKKQALLLRDSSLSDSPFAVTLGQTALQNLRGVSTFEWNQIEPLYIKASGAEEKRRT